MVAKVEGSVPGLPVEVARQAAEAERARRTKAMGVWLPDGSTRVIGVSALKVA